MKQRGIAPEAETYIVRVFDDNRNFYEFADGTAYSTDLIAAATICKEWGADIINASLGGNTYNRIEEEFFKNLLYESGILTVAASGNGGDDRNVYPAAYEGVLSVGAVDEYIRIAEFSTWDPSTTDILAPGKYKLVHHHLLKFKVSSKRLMNYFSDFKHYRSKHSEHI